MDVSRSEATLAQWGEGLVRLALPDVWRALGDAWSRALSQAWSSRFAPTTFARDWWDRVTWMTARGAVDAVRYQPRHVELLLACGASQPGVPAPFLSWIATTREQPAVARLTGVPHAAVRTIAAQAARWLGPSASAIVRWTSGATAAAADQIGAALLERPLRGRTHPGLLVPHPHDVAVVAIDMRGFTRLTHALDDTQHVTELIGEYLTVMTAIVERHRGVVFQYTGDGLLALFLPEIAASNAASMLDRLVQDLARELHDEFTAAYARWRGEWERSGRSVSPIGLGVGISFGRATIGYIGPAGKKQFGVIGEPVNLAAFLCSEAPAGTVLVDCASFTRAGGEAARGTPVRLRSKKRHQRLDAVRVRYGPPRDGWRRRLLSAETT